MSRTTLQVNVSPNYRLEVHATPSRGTDWGRTTLGAGTVIPAGSTRFTVGSIGDPGVLETDHWGWLNFWAIPVSGGLKFPIQLYIRESNSSVKEASLGYYASCSDAGNTMPCGTFGSVNVAKKPTEGLVIYSIG